MAYRPDVLWYHFLREADDERASRHSRVLKTYDSTLRVQLNLETIDAQSVLSHFIIVSMV